MTSAPSRNAPLYDAAPSLSVRVIDAGLVATGLTGRPGAATGAIPIGEGLFGAGDPDYPADQMWVPLDYERLECLHKMVSDAPVDLDALVTALERSARDPAKTKANLHRFFEQLRAAGLIAQTDQHRWSRAGRARRVDRIPWDRSAAEPRVDVVDIADEARLQTTDRCGLLVTADGFEQLHADGSTRTVLASRDVMVLSSIRLERTCRTAYEALTADPTLDLSRDEFDERLRALGERGLVRNVDPNFAENVAIALRSKLQVFQRAEASLRELVENERQRAERTGRKRPVVIALDPDVNPLLALGTVVAYAKSWNDGQLTSHYCFSPIVHTNPERVTELLAALDDWPAVVLFSSYLWTHAANLAMTEIVKQQLPGAVTVHGGPELPKYAEDAERYFREHPAIDCGVRGEGEATLAELLHALVPTIAAWSERQVPDLEPLTEVAGLTVRTQHGIVRTEERERIADLDAIPSPYLTGLFEDVERRQANSVIIESNRGCPYGCTFCDWGSATLSRIRKFSLDRVKAEMQWAVEKGIASIGLTDANFGIFDRDIEIAQWAADLKARYGIPTELQVTYSKNRVKNLTQIVRILAEAGILTQAAVSVQTMDKQVLKIVRRKNLDIDKHVPLVQEFQDLRLPIYSDLMLGLPGSTVDTTRADLQFCIDREIHYRPNPTQLLVNSPMNDEAYRTEHGIVAKPGEYLLESRTYTREDMRVMADLAEYLLMADRRGTFRELATYVRSELRLPEMEFYERLINAGRDSTRWPHLGYVNTLVTREFVPPGSWTAVIEEIGDFMVELGVPDDDALATVLAVQRALIPMMGRSFPETLHLPHDYVAWHGIVRSVRNRVTDGEWGDEVPPLRSMAPGSLVIHATHEDCERVVGTKPRGSWEEILWELDTPIARSAQRPAMPTAAG